MTCHGIPARILPFVLILAMSLLIPAAPVFAGQNVNIKSESLVRFLERDTVSENNALIVPAYEYLNFDIGSSTVTFHASGFGRYDLTDNDFFSDQSTGELLYGYLEIRPTNNKITARLGRQTVFGGVANESIDGLYFDTALLSSLSLSAYAGQPVSVNDINSRDGDSIYGGRVGFRISKLNLGLSYKMLENDSTDSEEMAGVDYGITLHNLYIGGVSTYNLITEDFAEHSFDAIMSSEANRLRLFYQLFTFADYFGTGANNANPFRLLAQTYEELSSYGLELTRKISENAELGIKLTRNDYDLEEASHYAALLISLGDTKTQYGGEIGISEGENGRNDMLLARGYILRKFVGNRLIDQLSFDILYATYDQPIFNEDTSIFTSLSASSKLSERLMLKLSTDYESSPYYDSDVRGLVSLVYNYAGQ